MDNLQTNITIVSKCLCINPKSFWRWYRDHLSGFKDPDKQKEHFAHDVQVGRGRGKETIRVPILKVSNIGPNMAVDEKQIGEEMHTVLSNRDTGKVAMLAETVRFSDLQAVMKGISQECDIVQTLTRDLSATYKKFGNNVFFNASHTADKFHIISSLVDACQAVRVRYRQEALREKRLKYQQYKQQEKQRKKQCAQTGEAFDKQEFAYHEPTLSNGDTLLEVLARSRYLLFKYPGQWTLSQTRRAQALFEKYPEIETGYQLACEFRNWMKTANIGKKKTWLKLKLREWYKKVEQSEIDEILNFKSTVERNALEIMSYFTNGATNAIAENINGKIKRFVMINQGTRDREFFYFRLKNYFA